MNVIIDKAEPKRRQKAAEDFFLNQSGISEVSVEKLTLGDYLFTEEDNVVSVFEYKSFNDLCSSFFNGHLFSQLKDMEQFSEQNIPSFLMVCGNYTQYAKSRKRYGPQVSIEQITHIRSEVTTMYTTKLIEADTAPQSYHLMYSITLKLQKLKSGNLSLSDYYRNIERNTRTGSAEMDMWLSLPGIGKTTYDKIAGSLSFREFMSLIDPNQTAKENKRNIFLMKDVVIPEKTLLYLKGLQ